MTVVEVDDAALIGDRSRTLANHNIPMENCILDFNGNDCLDMMYHTLFRTLPNLAPNGHNSSDNIILVD